MALDSTVVMLGAAGVGREPSRDFTVRDPEGTLWAFGTYRPEP